MKRKNNTFVISNIVSLGNSKKEKTKSVNKLLVNICEQKEIPVVDHDDINTKRHLNKSSLHLNVHGKSVFVKVFEKCLIDGASVITTIKMGHLLL